MSDPRPFGVETRNVRLLAHPWRYPDRYVRPDAWPARWHLFGRKERK